MQYTEYKDYKIKIEQDDMEFNNPRKWDNLGLMVCFHRRYNLGDTHEFTPEETKIIENNDNYISLPLYLYDHSGITMNTTGFSCRWDSGQVGIICVPREKVRKEFKVKRIGRQLYNKVIKILKAEVELYDKYIRGEVFYYLVEDISEGDLLDSCGGFFDYEECLSEAKSIIDYRIKTTPQQLSLAV